MGAEGGRWKREKLRWLSNSLFENFKRSITRRSKQKKIDFWIYKNMCDARRWRYVINWQDGTVNFLSKSRRIFWQLGLLLIIQLWMRAHFDSLQEVIKEHRICTSNRKEKPERSIKLNPGWWHCRYAEDWFTNKSDWTDVMEIKLLDILINILQH